MLYILSSFHYSLIKTYKVVNSILSYKHRLTLTVDFLITVRYLPHETVDVL